ncbi:MAG: hypothetical protein JWN42_1101 [Candidatus Angelobacter sp.]|nr:hypothetical protein [Candidatus Angelobacter sp.]
MPFDPQPAVAHTQVHRIARRLLEPAQDLLVLGIGLALFGLMVRTLIWLFREILRGNIDFREVIAQVLFMLVLVEVVRLVIIYLQEHRVAVDFMVELGIVATLREVVLRGVTELAWQQVVAVTLFLLALGALLRFGDLRAISSSKSDGLPAHENYLPQSTEQTNPTEERLDGTASFR